LVQGSISDLKTQFSEHIQFVREGEKFPLSEPQAGGADRSLPGQKATPIRRSDGFTVCVLTPLLRKGRPY
jgi:hypothetical protein